MSPVETNSQKSPLCESCLNSQVWGKNQEWKKKKRSAKGNLKKNVPGVLAEESRARTEAIEGRGNRGCRLGSGGDVDGDVYNSVLVKQLSKKKKYSRFIASANFRDMNPPP